MASKLWLEVWSRPGDPAYGRLIDDPLEVEGDFHDGLNQIGNGGMQLSNRSPYFDQILKADPDTPSNSRSSTVKIFSELDPTTPIFEWLPNQLFPESSKNDPLVQVSGLGIKALPAHARLEPYDWDGTDDFIPAQPDWEWGAGNLVTNWDFEENGVTNQKYSIEITATGGSFTLSDGTDTTAAIAWNGGTAGIANALEAGITAITDVAATQSGTSPPTYEVLLVTPPFGVALTLDPSGLSGGTATITELEEGGLSPTGWNRAQDILFGVVQDKGNYDAFEISDAQNHTPGGTYSLLIDPGPLGSTSNRDAGAQTIVQVVPGAVYQTSLWVYPTSGTDVYRLGLFTESGEWIASTPYSGMTLTPNVWNQMSIPDVLMPDNVNRVILRIQCLNTYPGDPSAFYIDDAEMYPGLAPTTVGEILRLIYEHAIDPTLRSPIVWDDGSATDTPYLTLDFSDALDSNGNAWDESELKTKFTMRMSYSQIMAALARDFGYEYRIVADDVETGTYHWQVYNPGTMQTDYTAAATPGIQGGAFDVRRNVNRFLPSGTDTMVEGLGRVTARARNAALMSALGRIEASRLNREAPDLTSAAESADESIANLLTNSRSLNYILVDPPDEPMSAYLIGDLLIVDDPPEVVASPARFVDVTCSFTPNNTEWEVQFGSARITNPDAAVASAVGGLLAKFEYPFPEPTTLDLGAGGAGGMATVLIAKSDSSQYSRDKADFILPTPTSDLGDLMRTFDPFILDYGTVWLAEAETEYSVSVAAGGLPQVAGIRGLGANALVQASDSAAGTIVSANIVHSLNVTGHASGTAQVGINAFSVRDCNAFMHHDATAVASSFVSGCQFNAKIVANSRSAMIVGNDWADNFAGRCLEASPGGGTQTGFVFTGNRASTAASGTGPRVLITNAEDGIISGNFFGASNGEEIIHLDTCQRINLDSNTFVCANGGHTIIVEDCDDVSVGNNMFRRIEMTGNDDTFDVIHITGSSTIRTHVHQNTIAGEGAIVDNNRSGVFVATGVNDTVIVGNVFSDTFGTSEIIDNGTGTLLAYPGGAIGDNFSI